MIKPSERNNCCCSVTQSCPTVCDPMASSMPGFSVLHYLPEPAQTHVHWVSDAEIIIQQEKDSSFMYWNSMMYPMIKKTFLLHIALFYRFMIVSFQFILWVFWRVLVTQSCPALCNSVSCSPLGSSLRGILQARILEWVAIPFSKNDWIIPGDLPSPGIEPGSPYQQTLYHLNHQWSSY